MSGRGPLDLLNEMNQRISQENEELRARLKSTGGGGTSGGMDLTAYRLDQSEKRAEMADARMARVEEKLGAIQLALAGIATKDTIRNWGLGIAAIVVATGAGMGAIMLQSAGNQLSAFQSGLSAIQAITAAAQAGAEQPGAAQDRGGTAHQHQQGDGHYRQPLE